MASFALFGDRWAGPIVVYECRRCGTTLDGPDENCPFGCSADVARYEI